MNKQEFLENLKKNLKGFTSDEIKDILYDYEEHFSIGANAGKTEEEIADELGNPKDIAEQYKKNKGANFENKTKYYTEKTKEKAKELSNDLNKNSDFITKFLIILATILLSPFIIAILGIFISLLLGGLGLIIGSFFGIVSSISLAVSTSGLISALFTGTIWISVSLLFLGIIMTILGLYAFKLVYILSKKAFIYITSKNNLKKYNKSFMNSKIIIALVVFLIFFIISLSIGLFQVIKSGTSITSDIIPEIIKEIDNLDNKLDFDFLGNHSNIDLSESHNLNEINSLNIDTTFSDIIFVNSDDDNLKATLTGSFNTFSNVENPINLSIEKDGNSLKIKEQHSISNLIIRSSNLVLTIYIPKDFNNDLTVNSISGNIKFNDPYTFNNLILNTVSGNIFCNSLQTKDIKLTSVSGNFDCSSLKTQNSKFETTSGNIAITDFQGNITLNSISGNIDLYLNKLLGNNTIDTKSGDIKLTLNPNDDLLVNMNTTSSKINYDKNLSNVSKVNIDKNKGTITFHNGFNKLNISSISGNINIKPEIN